MLLVFVEFCATRFLTIAEQYHEDHRCVRDRYTYIYNGRCYRQGFRKNTI